MDQNEVLLCTERNAWYDRNKSHLAERHSIANECHVFFICRSILYKEQDACLTNV